MSYKQPIVIAPTTHMAEWLCREILFINPKEHVMSSRIAATTGLRGCNEPTIILYDPDNFQLYNIDDYIIINDQFKICNAIVIRLPEIKRVIRAAEEW